MISRFFLTSEIHFFFISLLIFRYLPEYNTPQYYNVTRVVGPNTPSDPGVEAELDVQFIMGVASKKKIAVFYCFFSFFLLLVGVPTWFWSNPASDYHFLFL